MPDINSNTSQPRLLSFTLDGGTALNSQVSVSLENGVVVLVGRNGAGKSAILEGFKTISSLAAVGFDQIRSIYNDSPQILSIEILTPTDRRLEYKYEIITLDEYNNKTNMDASNVTVFSFSRNDYCQYLDGEKELLWITENGVTTFENKGSPIITIIGSISSFQITTLSGNSPVQIPIEMQWIRNILNGVHLLEKVPIRTTLERRKAGFKTSGVFFDSELDLINRLSFKILHLMNTGELYELESVCQRLGIGNKIAVEKSSGFMEETDYFFLVLLDGINIGLLSDGTLRILSILVELINLNPSATIIIEEPETQIHPGMLAKLLNEIEAYTFEKNLILSTHSPQVVAWTSPENINLVHRKDGKTFVRKLDEDEIHNVIEYISDEGDLGEWIYSGVLDE